MLGFVVLFQGLPFEVKRYALLAQLVGNVRGAFFPSTAGRETHGKLMGNSWETHGSPGTSHDLRP